MKTVGKHRTIEGSQVHVKYWFQKCLRFSQAGYMCFSPYKMGAFNTLLLRAQDGEYMMSSSRQECLKTSKMKHSICIHLWAREFHGIEIEIWYKK